MILADDFPTLERQVERCVREHAEKEADRKVTIKLLKSKFGVETIKDAKKLYKRLLKKQHRLMDEDIRQNKKFKTLYKDKLNREDD